MDVSLNKTTSPNIMGIDPVSLVLESTLSIGLAGFIATFLSFVIYISHSPKIDKKAPAFTSDAFPFIGSWRFFTQKM